MPERSERYQRVRVTERKDYATDLWSIRVEPEQPLAYKPGQYATLGVESDGRVLERPYSIVSSPLEPQIEFFFELVSEGKLTPLLYHAQVGETFLMRRQAKGLFGLDVKSGHKRHYLVSTVTGVAPYVSIVRSLARQAEKTAPPDLQVIVLQAASRSWEFAYREELEGLARGSSWLRYIPTISRPWEDPEWKGEVGRAEDVLRKYLDAMGLEPSSTTTYLCGHPEMIENAKGILQRRGFPKEFVREEIYWVPAKS